jgi:hypothetical protein
MELEINLPEDFETKEEIVELTKPRKKKVYTAPKTSKQLENFDKAKQIRLERINNKKLEDQEKIIKQILDNEKKIKNNDKQIKKSQKPQKLEVLSLAVEEPSSSDSDSDEEIIIKSKPKTKPKVKKPKKKTVVYLSSDSETESEDEIPVQKSRVQRKIPIQSPKPVQQPKQIQQQTEYKNYFI